MKSAGILCVFQAFRTEKPTKKDPATAAGDLFRDSLENDLPVLTGRFLSPDGGEPRENGRDASSAPIPWQLTWVQWFELQNTLAEAALPAYEKPPQNAAEEAGSEICIVWRTEDGERSEKCSGENAAALEALVLLIAEEAYGTSQLEAGLLRPAPKGG